MSTLNLNALLEPRSVVVVGASSQPHRVGTVVWNALHTPQGGMRFEGPVWAVNLKGGSLGDEPIYRRVADVPGQPDLAVVCTPPATVPGLVDELAAKGVRAVVLITAGLSAEERSATFGAARRHGVRLLGPNGLGLLVPHLGLSASFAHRGAVPGGLAFISQSGALLTSLLDWAAPRGLGFSRVVSLGEAMDVDFGDLLDYLLTDTRTQAVLLYIESVGAARKFMSAARALARVKPVIALKAGRELAGQKAAASHTGALASSDRVVDAALRRAGIARVPTLDACFAAAQTFGTQTPSLTSSTTARDATGLTILTNGGGAGVMAADAAASQGCELTVLSPETLRALAGCLPANWSNANPVDIIGDAPTQRYLDALEVLRNAPEVGDVLLIQAPTAIVPSAEVAQAIAPLAAAMAGRLFTCWLGDAGAQAARQALHAVGVACFDTPEQAVAALALRQRWKAKQRAGRTLIDTAPVAPEASSGLASAAPTAPPTTATSKARASATVLGAPAATTIANTAPRAERLALLQEMEAAARREGREWLTQAQALAVLKAYGVDTVTTRVLDWSARWPQARAASLPAAFASTPAVQEELTTLARAVHYPVVLKASSPDIVHKSDVGAVVLNIPNKAALLKAAAAMLARLAQALPTAQVSGFTLQHQAKPANAQELIIGASIDPSFGPVVLFGHGGTAVEVRQDTAVALPPITPGVAAEMVARTRVSRLLQAWRDHPAAHHAAVYAVLNAVGELLADWPALCELDINPLLASPAGALALDARMRLAPPDSTAPAGAARFAVAPYPAEQSRVVAWQGKATRVRPLEAADQAAYLRLLAAMEPLDIRLRVFSSRRSLTQGELEQLTDIDYAREVALVVTPADDPNTLLGVARASHSTQSPNPEIGVMVRSDLKGQGLGTVLMTDLLATLRARGCTRAELSVLDENKAMLALAKRLGFTEQGAAAGDMTRTLAIDLSR